MYTISYPSNTLRLDGVEIVQDEALPEYQTYLAWLAAGNGPEVIIEPPAPEPTVTAAQIVAAFAQLNLSEVTQGQLGSDVFNAARLL